MQIHFDLNTLPQFNNAVITIGSFDGVHLGHRTLLTHLLSITSRHKGESVVITFDPHPRLLLEESPKDFALLTNLDEKISLIEALGVDHLMIVPFTLEFSQQSARNYLNDFIIKYFNPAAIVVGYDHRYGAGRTGDLDLMIREFQGRNIEIIEIDPLLIKQIAISSSAIRRALAVGDISNVNGQLGYKYFIRGIVTAGDKIGRTIGYPTANLTLKDPFKALPANGVYAANVRIKGNEYNGMAYIGHRPVLGPDLVRVIEVNIFNFEEDIYGEEIDIQLAGHIRADLNLKSLEELKIRLLDDKVKVEEFFAVSHRKLLHDTAVIVLNYNGLHHLKEYLPELVKYTDGADIIVADNASTDGSVDYLMINHPDIRIIILDENYGFAKGYNLAIQQIENENILLLNSDVRVSAGWLQPLINRLNSSPKIAIVQPKILNDINQSSFDYAGAAGGWIDKLGYPFCRGRVFETLENDDHQYDDAQQVFWASGAALLIRRSIYQKLGGLDDHFFAHMEEIDLAWKVKNCGYEVWVEPASHIYHLGGGTLDALSPKKVYLNFRNSLFVLVKNEYNNAFFKVFTRLLLDGVAGTRFFLQGKFSYVGAILKAHLHFYLKLGYYLKQRSELKELIRAHSIDAPNLKGKLDKILVVEYFIQKRKTFKSLFNNISK